jgi:uncharacterized OB-fold protein
MTEKPVDVFRRHLESGELVIQKCAACGAFVMYPRHACPACQSEELGWQRASGRGVLHSFTVLRLGAPQGFEVDLPYALGVVKLAEGVQLLARLLPDADGGWSAYACDQPVLLAPPPVQQPVYRHCAWFRRAT